MYTKLLKRDPKSTIIGVSLIVNMKVISLCGAVF